MTIGSLARGQPVDAVCEQAMDDCRSIEPRAFSSSKGPKPLLTPARAHTHPNRTSQNKPARHHARMHQPGEQEQEQQRRRRLFESTQRPLRRASDDEVLGMLASSPPPPLTQGDLASAAASLGRGGLLLRALERGVLSPDTKCGKGTVVHLAARYGPLELLKSLVMERGVDPNETTTDGWRPLHIAIDEGREQEALFLINEAPGVDIGAPISRGDTPLMLAAEQGAMDVLRALVAKGADANATDADGFTPLHPAITRKQQAATLYLINEAPGVDIDALDPHKQTALLLAASVGQMAVVKALVAKGADVEAKNQSNGGPLHAAIQKGRDEVALYLVEEAGVEVYEPDAGLSVLSLAAVCSQCRVMRAIVQWMRADGVDGATVATEMGAAAHFAIKHKEVESLKPLVEEGLNVDQAAAIVRDGDSYELPLFHHACIHGNRRRRPCWWSGVATRSRAMAWGNGRTT